MHLVEIAILPLNSECILNIQMFGHTTTYIQTHNPAGNFKMSSFCVDASLFQVIFTTIKLHCSRYELFHVHACRDC